MTDRMTRERQTLRAMVAIFCRDRHRPQGDLCDTCRELLAYAQGRLAACPYGSGKPTCSRCPIHCYRPDRRERVREVMRYSGPRLALHRPWLALLHLRDGLRRVPPPRGGAKAGGRLGNP